jgi:hypothetical protein
VLWLNGRLLAARLVESGSKADLDYRAMALAVFSWVATVGIKDGVKSADALALEFPQLYGGRASRGGGNDLFPMAAVDGGIAALFPTATVQTIRPHDWKGSVIKPKSTKEPYIIQGRVVERLDAEEQKRVQWPTDKKKQWDVADAIGVGLHVLGRFERKRGDGVIR